MFPEAMDPGVKDLLLFAFRRTYRSGVQPGPTVRAEEASVVFGGAMERAGKEEWDR